jgi:acyl-CoA synthetase (AMP-forming)/AMP-acid ligase II
VARGDRALLSENWPEWALADYACLTAGFADVLIYATLPAEQIPYLLEDSGGGDVRYPRRRQDRERAVTLPGSRPSSRSTKPPGTTRT